MEEKFFYGEITPNDIARDLIAHFHQGNLQVQKIGNESKINLQIATRETAQSGGKTALNVRIQKITDGVSVQISEQKWLGLAASLGFTALSAISNPRNLLYRLDDLAQDIDNLSLQDEVEKVINQTARSLGAGHNLSKRFKRLTCVYCLTANPVGEPRCIACGAPLGDIQPETCKRCGYLLNRGENKCPNCGSAVN